MEIRALVGPQDDPAAVAFVRRIRTDMRALFHRDPPGMRNLPLPQIIPADAYLAASGPARSVHQRPRADFHRIAGEDDAAAFADRARGIRDARHVHDAVNG